MKSLKILLVEDDRVTQVIGKNYLEKYRDCFDELIIKENGAEAWDFLNRGLLGGSLPGLIILDINMPIMDGWELLMNMQDVPAFAEIPVCMLSSSVDPLDITRSTSFQQVKHYFTKPLKQQDIPKLLEFLETE
ncbi:response regulator [Nitritalea halalkaliphila LW7]|uniref:Response regulator n=1 Tax=Nitritalea halalkaliphila LW7 TaxID=1189621 RepID=I5C886_9BACT|nr:response regulator [Nitritalea halalkaliphila]EIM78038.1 response regulator [Nitritalea halalkaliphila LW7]